MLLDSNTIEVNACSIDLVSELRLPLVNRFYADSNYRVKCGRFECIYTLSQKGKIIAAARLIPQPSGCYLLRNLCVEPQLRNQGLASYLLRGILNRLAAADCYCYALPHLQNLYVSLEFKRLHPDQVPPEIAEMYLRHCARKRGWILMGHMQEVGYECHKDN